jgi:hypothetical protein
VRPRGPRAARHRLPRSDRRERSAPVMFRDLARRTRSSAGPRSPRRIRTLVSGCLVRVRA